MLDKILSGGITGIFKGAADIVDRFVQSPDERAKIMVDLRALEVRETEAITKAASAAIVMEAKSDDPWVRRARPTFLWLMYAILIINFGVIPLINAGTGSDLKPIDLPEKLYWLFGSGYLGYTGARGWDKMIKGKFK